MNVDGVYSGELAIQFVWGAAGIAISKEFERCHEAILAGQVPARTIPHQKNGDKVTYRRADLLAWATTAVGARDKAVAN